MSLPAKISLHAVVPAAGTGQRMQAGLPKQYLTLAGRTLAEHTLCRLLSLARLEQVVVPVAPEDEWWSALSISGHPRVHSVIGGKTRAESVCNGLRYLVEQGCAQDWVLVHDVARPCVRLSDIQALIDQTSDQGAILAVQATDTMKEADDDGIRATLDRTQIWHALTPQLFPVGKLLDALLAALSARLPVTDESSAMEQAGYRPSIVEGRSDNIKITRPEDLRLAEFWLMQQEGEGWQWQTYA